MALLARSKDYLDHLAAELNRGASQAAVIALPCDLADAEQIRAAFDAARAQLGSVDQLVNHAAGGGPARAGLLGVKLANFEGAWRVGVLSALLCSRAAARDMLADGRGGTILFTGATSSIRGAALAFFSAKFAARGLAQSLARELWPQGIHVAHAIIDGVIGEEENTGGDDEPLMHPDAIADSYWLLARQERSAWTWELDLRPDREKFFE